MEGECEVLPLAANEERSATYWCFRYLWTHPWTGEVDFRWTLHNYQLI